MADIDFNALLSGRRRIQKLGPFILELASFAKHEWHEFPQVLNRKRGRSYPSLTSVNMAFCREHATANKAGDQSARLPWFLVDSGVFEHMGKRGGIKGKEAIIPL